MWLFKSKKITGFSLVETVIVLSIAVGIIFIPTLQTRDLMNTLEKRQIVNTFKNNFNNGTKHAVIDKTTVTIRYHKPERLIYFYYSNNQINQMEIPKDMTVLGLSRDIRISKNGSVSPKTITFKTENWQKTLKIQMKWGQLIETD